MHKVATAPHRAPDTSKAGRVPSVDMVRGAVMIFMALDHVRDFVTNLRFPPENLARSSLPLFLTRWVTHFCAPAFFVLAGVGIGISLKRGKRPGDLSRYLVVRGLWLLFLELIITPIGWQFGFDLIPAFALVLWALGWSMIAMAALIHLPRSHMLIISLAMILLHNLLDPIRSETLGDYAGLWQVLHAPGFAIANVLFVAYPLIPWLGVMALGFVLARVYDWDDERRRRALIAAGVAATLAFVALRALNAYGNPFPWSAQRTIGMTVASFLNLLKYPPSLQFLLMTLGPILIALALFESARGRVVTWLSVYGRVPLFFYVVHIFIAHAAAVVLAFIQSGEVRRIPVVTDAASLPDWYGVALPGVYGFWVLVVLLLYYPCKWFARMKETRSDWWLSYL